MLGVATLPELIALAKTTTGRNLLCGDRRRRLTHLTGELLQSRAGIKLLLVPYSGGPTHSLNDVLGRPHPDDHRSLSGARRSDSSRVRIRAIAVGSAQRLPDFPDLPTVAETLPGFHAVGWQGLLAPIGTPESDRAARSATICARCSTSRISRSSWRRAAAMFGRCRRLKSLHSSAASSRPGTRCCSSSSSSRSDYCFGL